MHWIIGILIGIGLFGFAICILSWEGENNDKNN